MKFKVILKLTVEAEDREAAEDMAIGACEHLNDTYNDDDSIEPFMGWEVSPLTGALL